jgi:hypothetical protein
MSKITRSVAFTIKTNYSGVGTGAIGESCSDFMKKLKHALDTGDFKGVDVNWLSAEEIIYLSKKE